MRIHSALFRRWLAFRSRRAPVRRGRFERLPPGLLTGADLVVVDVETTGWLADSARITEIGAVRLACDQPVREFCELVNPGMPIPAHITELTGITDNMVASSPSIGEVLPRFIEFASGSVIVAHNAPFDLGFLTAAAETIGIGWRPCAVIDTAVLARLVLNPGSVPDHKLTTLAEYFGTRTDPCHRALADAKATAGVLGGLLSLLGAGPGGRPPGTPRAAGPGDDPPEPPARRGRQAATITPQPGHRLPRPRRRRWSQRSF